jgi:hypothetical protein
MARPGTFFPLFGWNDIMAEYYTAEVWSFKASPC